jgi:beta-glucosidase
MGALTRGTFAGVISLLAGCGDGLPHFSQADIDAARLLEGVPRGFYLGTATSHHQIEGGLDDDWTTWERAVDAHGKPRVARGDTADVAADSWNRWPADVAATQRLGANAYRMSVAWSRLMPADGQWDDAAASRYRQQLTALRALGVSPMVTLHHFALPHWIADAGGWEWSGAPAALEDFAARAGAAFGDLVDLWCTVNEPNVLAVEGYTEGIWPPGVEGDTARTARVLRNELRGHALAAAALRRTDVVDADGDGRATSIGVAHNVQVFDPATFSPLDVDIAAVTDAFFNDSTPRALATGRVQLKVPGSIDLDEAIPGLAGSVDWLGINYYTRSFVRADLTDPALAVQVTPSDVTQNDLGWEIYPEGLYRTLVRFARFGWPLLVTENGIPDGAGTTRPGFLRSHLYALDRARADGADVRGYFHWSLIDNFEWADGLAPRFGLFGVDYADPGLARTETPAVSTFRGIAEDAGLVPTP